MVIARYMLSLAALMRMASGGLLAQQGPTASRMLTEANQKYNQYSYSSALERYEKLMKANAVPADQRDLVGYRMVVCLRAMQRWDQALSTGTAFVQNHRGSIWEARGIVEMARLYADADKSGWRLGNKIYRGDDPPKTDSTEKPVQIYLRQIDQRNRLDALEAACVLYSKLPIVTPADYKEHLLVNTWLINALQRSPQPVRRTYQSWGNTGLMGWIATEKASSINSWLPPDDPIWKIDPQGIYDPAWPFPKKIMYLYRTSENAAMLPQVHDHKGLAEVRYSQALWLNAYQTQMRESAQKIEQNKNVPIPYPYQDLKPEGILKEIERDLPNTEMAASAATMIAIWQTRAGTPSQQIAAYRNVIARYPKSDSAKRLARTIKRMTDPEIRQPEADAAQPGSKAVVKFNVKSVRSIHFQAYRLDLPTLFGTPVRFHKTRSYYQSEADTNLADITSRMLDPKEARKLIASGMVQPFKTWDERVTDKGDYIPHKTRITLPWTEAGNYLLVASIPYAKKSYANKSYAIIVPYHDMVLIRKNSVGGDLLYVANRTTGRPIPNAHVLARQYWQNEQRRGVTVDKFVSDQNGMVTLRPSHKPNYQLDTLELMAWKGKEAVLLADNDGPQWLDSQSYAGIKAYCTTDRTVYRPQQMVRFRQLLLQTSMAKLKGRERRDNREAKRYLPLSNRKVRVVINGQQGNEIYKKLLTTDAFGVVSGEFALPADAPLGAYQIATSLPANKTSNSPASQEEIEISEAGNTFRVEEYKKPEYRVTVTAGTDRIKLGKPVEMKVHGEYYFGGPVPNANVTYKVHTTPYTPTYRFPRPYDYLQRGESDLDDLDRSPVIAQGKTTLDAHGDATIRFESTLGQNGDQREDRNFSVEVEVQDASRRVIKGSGNVRATQHDVAVFLDFPHGYATQGDRIDVEVKTLNPSNIPVSANGTARVYLQPTVPNGKEKLVYETPLKTDTQGYAKIRWQNQQAGYYRVEFSTKDSDGATVNAGLPVWVDGAALRSQRFLFQGVHLAVRSPYYSEGETARALLVTPEPGCTVLLTREVENKIVERRLVTVPGRSLEITVPITGADVPNVFLAAVMVRHGEIYQAEQELFIPPTRQSLKVAIRPDKSRYAPGEKAHWSVTVTDYAGHPVRTSLSLAVTDAALAYIQKSDAPDIRTYLYGERRTKNIRLNVSYRGSFWVAENASEDDESSNVMVIRGGAASTDSRLVADSTALAAEGRMPTSSASSMSVELAKESKNKALASIPAKMAYHQLALKLPEPKPALPPVAPAMGGETLAVATIRKEFKDTAFWLPALVTDAQGHATVDFAWPDNLTEWQAHAIGSSLTAQVGMANATVTTKKDLLVQLETPRFLVERDIATFSAIVHNDTDKDQKVLVRIFLDNADITGEETVRNNTAPRLRLVANQNNTQENNPKDKQENKQEDKSGRLRVRVSETWITIPRGTQKRVDWLIRPQHEGEMHIRMAAQSSTDADATQATLPVLVHGVERTRAVSGKMVSEGNANSQVTVSLPELRKPGSSQLLVTLNPSLAGVLLDALPYLADYPYGCVEQTMSRFLPSVLVAHALQASGYDLPTLQKAIVQERKNIALASGQKQANSVYTYPGGLSNGQKAAFPGGMPPGRLDTDNPVLTAGMLNRMVKSGLQRLADFQHPDGGWGWWKEGDSDPHMTAYVLDGLLQCQRCNIAVNDQIIDQATSYLLAHYQNETDLHRLAYQAYVLSQIPNKKNNIFARIEKRLWVDREKLNPYSKALLALTLWQVGQKQQAQIVLENLQTTMQVDEQHATAHWEENNTYWWYWYNDKIETNATILRAYTEIAPTSPIPAQLAKWLVENRNGSSWKETRDTSIAVSALADWMRASKETAPNYTITLDLGGRIKRSYRVTPQNALFFDNSFVVPDALLTTGDQTLTLTIEGKGVCYYTAQTRTFSQEEPIPPTGDQITVSRRYFRLTARPIPVKVKSTVKKQEMGVAENPFITGRYELLDMDLEKDLEKEETEEGVVPVPVDQLYDREEIKEGQLIQSGDLIEVELLLEASNDYEYVLVEDMKPAGCEPVDLVSGGDYSPGLYANREMRDTKVAYFLDRLPQGRRLLNYRMHAEVPGLFHTLPTNISAMYAPTVRALSGESRLGIRDQAE